MAERFSDQEEELIVQLFKFETNMMVYSRATVPLTLPVLIEGWERFKESIPEINAANYPKLHKKIKALFSLFPQVEKKMEPFMAEIDRFINRVGMEQVMPQITSALRQRQIETAIEKRTEVLPSVFKTPDFQENYEEVMKRKQCPCGKTKKDETRMKFCSKCKVQSYCGAECQKADWPRHKAECAVLCAENAANFTGFKKKNASKGGKRRKIRKTRKSCLNFY
jgi:hypothetical protein